MASTIDLLLRDITTRVPTAAGTPEQHDKVLQALACADAALQLEFLQYPSVDEVRARCAAYHNVQQVVAHPRYPERPFEPASDEGESAIYETEVVRLWTIVECVLADRLDGLAASPIRLRE